MMEDVGNANFDAAWAISMDAQLLPLQERIPVRILSYYSYYKTMTSDRLEHGNDCSTNGG